ncbi:hypothetical protein [Streptomyces sp. NPDC003299]
MTVHPGAARRRTARIPNVEMLRLLPVPARQLTDLQRRGNTCVWCGIAFAPGQGHDLGSRLEPFTTEWFPRGCTSCVGAQARRVYALHARTCGTCTRNVEACNVRRGLWNLALAMREGWS